MSEQTYNSPSPLSNADEPPEITAKPNEWHYVDGGVKKGPVSATAIRDLLSKKEIEPDTQVWRKGMIEWKSIRQSDLAELVATEPPAISPHHIGNGYVWVLAFLPLVWGIVDASIEASNQQAAARTMVLGFPYHPSKSVPFQIPLLINGLFGWLDELRLRKAGYGSKWMRAAAVLLAPIYLFVRAKRLKQRPWYAVCWILTFLLGVFLVAAVQAGL
jgi:GYF domain 2